MMNKAQKDHLDREIKKAVRRCRRCISAKAWRAAEIEEGTLHALWELRQQMRKLEGVR
jgi:hypothetical protein